MNIQFDTERENIDRLYKQKQYIVCLQKCMYLLRNIDKNDNCENEKQFYCYQKMANIYAYLEKFDSALKFVKKEMIYAETPVDIILANWTFSFVYYKMNKYSEGIKYIETAMRVCEENKIWHWFYGALVHHSLLTNNEEALLEAIEETKKLNEDEERIELYYGDLFELYRLNNEYFKALNVLNYIQSVEYKNNLKSRIYKTVSIG